MNIMSNIVVAGAGTTGWLTALYARKVWPTSKIIVIYDDKIPIIGVGESTTPNFLDFAENWLDINTSDLVKECEATLKLGIKFTNWKGDNSHYYHTFTINPTDLYFSALSKGNHLDEVDLGAKLSEMNKVPFQNHGIERLSGDEQRNVNVALHFNAKLMAEYLQKIGLKRGISIAVGKIEDVKLDKDQYVSEIILDTKDRIQSGFVFDCTGFGRVFINGVYKSPMNSYEKFLPVKRAMPFFIDKNDETPPYTECTAMKYGWMWKIPVGKRFGCGYVFDSDLTTDEEAYQEICQVTGQKPTVPRKINFKSGYHPNPLNKNTLALGLAHGFLEPLEATSIMITIDMLHLIRQTIPEQSLIRRIKRDDFAKDYNRIADRIVTNCRDFVFLHYLTPRNDTKFWKRFNDQPYPKTLSKIFNLLEDYDVCKPNELRSDSFGPFHRRSFVQCLSGVGGISENLIKRNTHEYTVSEVCKMKIKDDYTVKRSMLHDEALNEILNHPEWKLSNNGRY